MTDKHEKTPDLLLTTARAVRDHLGSIGKGKLCDDLNAALKPHDEKAAAEQAKDDAAAAKAQAAEDEAAEKQRAKDERQAHRDR